MSAGTYSPTAPQQHQSCHTGTEQQYCEWAVNPMQAGTNRSSVQVQYTHPVKTRKSDVSKTAVDMHWVYQVEECHTAPL